MKSEEDSAGALKFYWEAYDYLVSAGLNHEIEYTRNLRFSECGDEHFLMEYVFVVVSSGMKNQVAQRIFTRFCKALDPSVIGHPGKRQAVTRAIQEHHEWLSQLRVAPDKLAYLESLPWIGPITKYHLARNIGLDFVKPDRHLVRVAKAFNYPDPHIMCTQLSEQVGERIGVVDVILWRYCNLKGTKSLGAGP